jgi:glycosyltransferase involved in cell wall biosynthesis
VENLGVYVFIFSAIPAASCGVFDKIKNPVVIKIFELMESFIYKNSNALVAVTKGIEKKLAKRHNSVFLVTNAVDAEKFKPIKTPHEKFVVGYIGNLGVAQGIDTIIYCALNFNNDPDICFMLVGEGECKEEMVEFAKALKLQNISFHSAVSRDEIPNVLGKMDVCIVSLKNIELFDGAIPSKTFELMACEKPIIASGGKELASIIMGANAGIAVPPENVQKLCETIATLKNKPEYLETFGKNGREYVLSHYSRKNLTKKLSLLLELVGKMRNDA